MKTVLVGPELEENLGLRYLAAALRGAGHGCEVVSFNREGELPRVTRRILRSGPGLVGLALVAQHRYGDVGRLVEGLRRGGYGGHVTAGGHFASLRAGEILRDTPGLDTILHHDAEERIVALADWVASSPPGEPPEDLDGLTWRVNGTVRHRPPIRVPAIDGLAPPWRRRPDRCLGYPVAPIISSRGCAGSCSFCSIHAWHRQVRSGRLRFRAPEAVADEMVSLHRRHGVRLFVFHDDDFIHPDKRRALPRCRSILEAAQERIGESIAFVVKARPDDVEEPLFRYLKSAGLVRAYVGIETHSRAGIRTLNRRVTPEQNERALAILTDLDVYACFNLLVFHPESTAEELEENLAFLERHLDVPFDVARTELYARSALEDRLVREGRAIGDYRGYDYRIEDPVAEASFRLFAEVLWARQFEGDSILRRTQTLRLRLSLLEHLHAGMAPVELRTRVQRLVRDTNSDTVRYLRRFVDVAREFDGEISRGCMADLKAELGPEIASRLRAQRGRWAALSGELAARAALGRLGLESLSLPAATPRMATRLAGVAPALAAALSSVACGLIEPEPQLFDPPPPPCTQMLALQLARAVPSRGHITAPFSTSEPGRLEVTVDWTWPESDIGVFLAPAWCTAEHFATGICDFLASSQSGPKPRCLSIPTVPAGAYQVVIVNWSEVGESVAAQAILYPPSCDSSAFWSAPSCRNP